LTFSVLTFDKSTAVGFRGTPAEQWCRIL